MTVHCWKDYREHLEERYGYYSDLYLAAAKRDGLWGPAGEWCGVEIEDVVGATCFLEDGHSGDHSWTPDREIAVSFVGKSDVETPGPDDGAAPF